MCECVCVCVWLASLQGDEGPVKDSGDIEVRRGERLPRTLSHTVNVHCRTNYGHVIPVLQGHLRVVAGRERERSFSKFMAKKT